MRLLILISFFGLLAQSCAKEIKLSASPNGRYEVIIAIEPDDDSPFARIRDKKTGKTLDTDAHGYDHRPYIEAIWRQDSSVVALNFSAGKTLVKLRSILSATVGSPKSSFLVLS
jgi:hypothetical protein